MLLGVASCGEDSAPEAASDPSSTETSAAAPEPSTVPPSTSARPPQPASFVELCTGVIREGLLFNTVDLTSGAVSGDQVPGPVDAAVDPTVQWKTLATSCPPS